MGSSISKKYSNENDYNKQNPANKSDKSNLKRANIISEIEEPITLEKVIISKEVVNNEIEKDSINSSFLKEDEKENLSTDLQEDIKSISLKNFDLEIEQIQDIKKPNQHKRESLFKNKNQGILINEEDIYFENILRDKLLKKVESENYMLNLIHIDELKIPFPLEIEKYDDDKHLNDSIEDIKKNIKGKYIVENGIIETFNRDSLISFINCKEEKKDIKSILLKNNYLKEDEIFNNYIGINFKRINNETYAVYYLLARKA